MDTKIKIDITLNSDCIFSSGFSIPGGDDISVYKDELGYPYFKATSFKGLLRESVENIIFCSNGDQSIVDNLFGVESFDMQSEQIKFTSFVLDELKNKNISKDKIFSKRVFTTIENGTAKDGSLRSAEVINKGLVFSGDILCNSSDVNLIKQGLEAIKWIGLLKNRGFGKISLSLSEEKNKNRNKKADKIVDAKYLHFKIKTLAPTIITDIKNSDSNNLKTKNYITGSAIRGMVLNYIAKNNYIYFEKNKVDLLETKFSNAYLCIDNEITIPTIKGFYEDKQEEGLENIVVNGEFEAGKKRASVGNVCSFSNDKILYSKTDTSSVTRIKCGYNEDNLIFSTEYINENQQFDGYILIQNEKLAPEIAKAFENEIWIGADRSEGFGQCEVLDICSCDKIDYLEKYGYTDQSDIKNELYFVALSPFTMLNEFLEPCGIDLDVLAKKLYVNNVEIKYASTSASEYTGFNSKWKAHNSNVSMYDEGCIFKLICSEAPKLENILNVQNSGLGIRTEEGYGQILFIKNSIIDSIKSKQSLYNNEIKNLIEEKAKLRQAKIKWIMGTEKTISNMPLSKSQLGEIQSLCEAGDFNKLNEFLDKKTDISFPKIKFKFQDIKAFIDQFMKNSIEQTFGSAVIENSNANKLDILCELFNYTRKGGE